MQFPISPQRSDNLSCVIPFSRFTFFLPLLFFLCNDFTQRVQCSHCTRYKKSSFHLLSLINYSRLILSHCIDCPGHAKSDWDNDASKSLRWFHSLLKNSPIRVKQALTALTQPAFMHFLTISHFTPFPWLFLHPLIHAGPLTTDCCPVQMTITNWMMRIRGWAEWVLDKENDPF